MKNTTIITDLEICNTDLYSLKNTLDIFKQRLLQGNKYSKIDINILNRRKKKLEEML